MEFRMDSCVRGYHVYDEIWTAVLGEVLITERELHNVADCYAVAVKKHAGETVGHLPKKISMLCSTFIDKGGDITVTDCGSLVSTVWIADLQAHLFASTYKSRQY